MKTAKILGATTLAGALLFTGVGHVNAAENVTASQAKDSVQDFVTNNSDYQLAKNSKFVENNEHVDNPISNSHSVLFGEEKNQSPTTLFVKKDTGDIYNWDGKLLKKGSINSEQNTNQSSQNVENNVDTQNNNQQAQTTTDETQNTANDNTKSENNTQALPETGEQSTNTGLVASIATLLLAVGSALTFKRFSKNNK